MASTNTMNKTQKISTIDLVMTGIFTAIICVMAQIVIPTQPVPFSLAILAIFLTGALLTPRNAFFATLAYLLLGAFGVPVFAGFTLGLGHLTGYLGGFLVSYPIMAVVISLFYKYSKRYRVIALTVGMVLSLLICYLLGTLWFMHVTGNSFYAALTACVIPFALFDVIKIALAISLSTMIRRTALKNVIQ